MRGFINYTVCLFLGLLGRAISESAHIGLAVMIAAALWLLSDTIAAAKDDILKAMKEKKGT